MKALVSVASIVIIIAGLRAGSAVLVPLVAAAFVTLLTFPIVQSLRRSGVPRLVAVTMTVLAILAVIVGPSAGIAAAVRRFGAAAPEYEDRLRQLAAGAFAWLRSYNIETQHIAGFFDAGRVLNVLVGALGAIVTLFWVGFLVVLIAAFMLVAATAVADRRGVVLPDGLRDNLARITRQIQGYLAVKTVVSMGTGLTAGAWVGFLGVDFAVLWGLLAFVLNFVPNIGSVLAAFPPALLALVQFGPGAAALVVLGYVAVNSLFSYFVEPYLMGRRLNLSPLVVVVSVITWGWIWGVAGVLLAVPMTMVIKLGLESSDDLKWVAALMSGDNGDGH
ncbi:AI-2E family transporter [soil metagenome]